MSKPYDIFSLVQGSFTVHKLSKFNSLEIENDCLSIDSNSETTRKITGLMAHVFIKSSNKCLNFH